VALVEQAHGDARNLVRRQRGLDLGIQLAEEGVRALRIGGGGAAGRDGAWGCRLCRSG